MSGYDACYYIVVLHFFKHKEGFQGQTQNLNMKQKTISMSFGCFFLQEKLTFWKVVTWLEQERTRRVHWIGVMPEAKQ